MVYISIHNKTQYIINIYKVKTSSFIEETSALCLQAPVYLFVSQDENKTVQYSTEDSNYDYKTIDCDATETESTYYTFFFVDFSHNLVSSKLNHKTISVLKNDYNLTHISGTKLTSEDDNIIVNNISDQNIVNVWNKKDKGQFGYSNINNQRVMRACLYNFKREPVISRSKYLQKNVLDVNQPYATYKIFV